MYFVLSCLKTYLSLLCCTFVRKCVYPSIVDGGIQIIRILSAVATRQ